VAERTAQVDDWETVSATKAAASDWETIPAKPANLPGTAGNMAGAFLEGAIVDPIKAGFMALVRPKADLLKNIVDSHVRQGKRVADDWHRGRYIDMAADALMTIPPVIGPMFGDAAENINTAIREKNPTAAARSVGNMTSAIVADPAIAAAVKAAPVTGAFIKGAAKSVPAQIRPTLEAIDIIHPGRDAMALYDAAGNVVRGGKAGVESLRAQQRIQPGRAVAPADVPASVDASPIPGQLPSGRRPLTPVEIDFLNQKKSRPPAVTVPVQPIEIPDLSPIMGELPSGRTVGPILRQPITRTPTTVAPSVDAPVNATPITGPLPSGRRPLTAAERAAKYAQPRASPTADAILADYAQQYGGDATKAQTSPVSKLSPELQATAQQLADELGPQGAPPERPNVQYEAGARAKKVWNMSDLLAEHGLTAEDAALMGDEQWAMATQAINQANAIEAAGSKFNRHHMPSAQSRQQIIQEMRDAEARRSQP
jgi:hypothetical protein